jgi:hypothetical protein
VLCSVEVPTLSSTTADAIRTPLDRAEEGEPVYSSFMTNDPTEPTEPPHRDSDAGLPKYVIIGVVAGMLAGAVGGLVVPSLGVGFGLSIGIIVGIAFGMALWFARRGGTRP